MKKKENRTCVNYEIFKDWWKKNYKADKPECATVSIEDGDFDIHTEVNPDFSGQGVGKKMVMDAVDFARANHIKIIPLCPFAKSVFEKEAEIRDVLS